MSKAIEMTRDEKLQAVERRSLGPNPRPIMRMPDLPPYFKADPNARAFWEKHEEDLWEWVKNLELDMSRQIQSTINQATSRAVAAAQATQPGAGTTVINNIDQGEEQDEKAFYLLQINGY